MEAETEMQIDKDLEEFLDKKSAVASKIVDYLRNLHDIDPLSMTIIQQIVGRNKRVTTAIAGPFSELRKKLSNICGVDVTYAEVDWLLQHVIGPIGKEVAKEKKRLPVLAMYNMFGIELNNREKMSIVNYFEGVNK